MNGGYTMAPRQLVVLTAAVLMTPVAIHSAFGDVRREKTERRPYIVEIGEPYEIDLTGVQREARNITQLREDLELHGYPDYAEVQEVQPDAPWETTEVRLYY